MAEAGGSEDEVAKTVHFPLYVEYVLWRVQHAAGGRSRALCESRHINRMTTNSGSHDHSLVHGRLCTRAYCKP